MGGVADEDRERARKRLAAVLRKIASKDRQRLEELKKEYVQLKRPDFVWHFLLQSFATWGKASGSDGLIRNPQNYNKITYEALSSIPADERPQVLEQTLRDAKVRYPEKKAKYLAWNFDLIQAIGGIAAAKDELLKSPGKQAKIEFLEAFKGIGAKYARNIMMDVYHEDFRDSIAVDARIKGVSRALGLSFNSYEEEEGFYRDVANHAGLQAWELDRLIFNFRPEILAELAKSNQ
jgi:thermostable 8-oxoguanine DNA glycosylase